MDRARRRVHGPSTQKLQANREMTEELTNLKLMGFSIEVETDPITLQLQTDKGPFSVEISKTQLAKLVYALRFVLYAEEPLQRKRLRKEAEVELVPAPSEEPKKSRRSKAMPNLYEILADAQNGQAMAGLGRELGLTSRQTQTAVAALLPAISMGLKRSTATPEGLGDLFGVMGQQPNLYAMYDDPNTAFSREGREAGNAVLSQMFGSPDASRAIADQAQHFSGVTSDILKKLLPVLAGILISGLMRSKPGQASPSAPQTSPEQGSGALGDILRQIFGQGSSESAGPAASPAPSAPQTAPKQDGSLRDKLGPGPGYQLPTGGQQSPGGQPAPGGDILAQMMRELAKAIEEGRLKPVVVGPIEIGIPGQAGPAGQTQTPMGDIFGQILRDLLGGKGRQTQPAGLTIFGDRLEAGRAVEQNQLDSFQKVFDRFLGNQRS